MAELFPGAQALVVLVPLLGAAGVALLRRAEVASLVVIAAAVLTLLLALRLPGATPGGLMLGDALSAHMALLTAAVGALTAWYSRSHMLGELAAGRMDAGALRHYHALFLALLGCTLLALLADDLIVGWIAIEAATICGVLAVALPGGSKAAWRNLLGCSAGGALALFGILLLSLAAPPATGWTGLAAAARSSQPALLNLAFVFLLVGYATLAGLAPLHGWLADAQAAGPVPVAVLSGSVLNVALVVLLRLRGVMAANPAALAPGPPLLLLGLASVLLAAFGLWRCRELRRFLALSSVGQNGLVAVAFGLGGPVAVFAGLLHMTLHTLTKAALQQCAGHAAQRTSRRLLGPTLVASIVALAGLPPFGLFASQFLIATEAVRRAPLLAAPLLLGLLVGTWALLSRLVALRAAPAQPERGPPLPPMALLPPWIMLAAVLLAGVALPGPLAAWLHGIAAAFS